MSSWCTQSVNGKAETIMDSWLLGVLSKERNRLMLARLEDSLTAFINDNNAQRLEFPPKNAYQRKIFHRVALYYGLDHRILEAEAKGAATEVRSLVLIKTVDSKVPKVRLSNMNLETARKGLEEMSLGVNVGGPRRSSTERGDMKDGHSVVNKREKSVFLRRPQSDSDLYKAGDMRQSGGNSKGKSISEKEYEMARARIFKKDAPMLSVSGLASMNGSEKSEFGVKVAAGPAEGSIGFGGRGRGLRNAGKPALKPGLLAKSQTADPLGGKRKSSQSSANTSRRKGSLGNGEPKSSTQGDANDPDFDRSFSRWAAPGLCMHPQMCPVQCGAYYENPGYGNYEYPLPHALQADTAQQHAYAGMTAGQGGYELMMSNGNRVTDTLSVTQTQIPNFDLDTTTDFPSLTQAQEISNRQKK